MSKETVIKFLVAIVLYAGMMYLVDVRLRQVEHARCEMNQWDVCAKQAGNQMLLTPSTVDK